MSDVVEWQPFTSRIGRSPRLGCYSDAEHWRYRHLPWHEQLGEGVCEADQHRSCRCAGTFQYRGSERQCCGTIIAEDLRCDDCRKYCWGVNESGEQVQIPVLSGYTQTAHERG